MERASTKPRVSWSLFELTACLYIQCLNSLMLPSHVQVTPRKLLNTLTVSFQFYLSLNRGYTLSFTLIYSFVLFSIRDPASVQHVSCFILVSNLFYFVIA